MVCLAPDSYTWMMSNSGFGKHILRDELCYLALKNWHSRDISCLILLAAPCAARSACAQTIVVVNRCCCSLAMMSCQQERGRSWIPILKRKAHMSTQEPGTAEACAGCEGTCHVCPPHRALMLSLLPTRTAPCHACTQAGNTPIGTPQRLSTANAHNKAGTPSSLLRRPRAEDELVRGAQASLCNEDWGSVRS
eukprot:1161424-Pelagomonas_calceolata.AAC.10